MKKIIFYLLIFFISTSFYKQDDLSKRYYSDKNFTYVFYINLSEKKIKLKETVKYYWYKSKQINATFFGYDGTVLHGEYLKRKIKTKELIENGFFKYGTKDGLWKEWYANGKLAKLEYWKKGLRNGIFKSFSKNGKLLYTGKYKNGKKEGNWIDFQKGDTLFYHQGEIKERIKLQTALKNLFKKKKSDSKNIKLDKKKKQKKVAKKEHKIQKTKTSKKQSFWNKIFKKKENKSKSKK